MNCPACASQMTRAFEMGIELDECSSCGGIWFDEGELKVLMDQGEAAIKQVEKEAVPRHETSTRVSDRSCPRCAIHLDTYRYDYESTVELDICRKCGGIWVDDGELDAIVAYNEACQATKDLETRKAEALGAMTESLDKTKRRARRVLETSKFLMTNVFGWGTSSFKFPKDKI